MDIIVGNEHNLLNGGETYDYNSVVKCTEVRDLSRVVGKEQCCSCSDCSPENCYIGRGSSEWDNSVRHSGNEGKSTETNQKNGITVKSKKSNSFSSVDGNSSKEEFERNNNNRRSLDGLNQVERITNLLPSVVSSNLLSGIKASISKAEDILNDKREGISRMFVRQCDSENRPTRASAFNVRQTIQNRQLQQERREKKALRKKLREHFRSTSQGRERSDSFRSSCSTHSSSSVKSRSLGDLDQEEEFRTELPLEVKVQSNPTLDSEKNGVSTYLFGTNLFDSDTSGNYKSGARIMPPVSSDVSEADLVSSEKRFSKGAITETNLSSDSLNVSETTHNVVNGHCHSEKAANKYTHKDINLDKSSRDSKSPVITIHRFRTESDSSYKEDSPELNLQLRPSNPSPLPPPRRNSKSRSTDELDLEQNNQPPWVRLAKERRSLRTPKSPSEILPDSASIVSYQEPEWVVKARKKLESLNICLTSTTDAASVCSQVTESSSAWSRGGLDALEDLREETTRMSEDLSEQAALKVTQDLEKISKERSRRMLEYSNLPISYENQTERQRVSFGNGVEEAKDKSKHCDRVGSKDEVRFGDLKHDWGGIQSKRSKHVTGKQKEMKIGEVKFDQPNMSKNEVKMEHPRKNSNVAGEKSAEQRGCSPELSPDFYGNVAKGDKRPVMMFGDDPSDIFSEKAPSVETKSSSKFESIAGPDPLKMTVEELNQNVEEYDFPVPNGKQDHNELLIILEENLKKADIVPEFISNEDDSQKPRSILKRRSSESVGQDQKLEGTSRCNRASTISVGSREDLVLDKKASSLKVEGEAHTDVHRRKSRVTIEEAEELSPEAERRNSFIPSKDRRFKSFERDGEGYPEFLLNDRENVPGKVKVPAESFGFTDGDMMYDDSDRLSQSKDNTSNILRPGFTKERNLESSGVKFNVDRNVTATKFVDSSQEHSRTNSGDTYFDSKFSNHQDTRSGQSRSLDNPFSEVSRNREDYIYFSGQESKPDISDNMLCKDRSPERRQKKISSSRESYLNLVNQFSRNDFFSGRSSLKESVGSPLVPHQKPPEISSAQPLSHAENTLKVPSQSSTNIGLEMTPETTTNFGKTDRVLLNGRTNISDPVSPGSKSPRLKDTHAEKTSEVSRISLPAKYDSHRILDGEETKVPRRHKTRVFSNEDGVNKSTEMGVSSSYSTEMSENLVSGFHEKKPSFDASPSFLDNIPRSVQLEIIDRRRKSNSLGSERRHSTLLEWENKQRQKLDEEEKSRSNKSILGLNPVSSKIRDLVKINSSVLFSRFSKDRKNSFKESLKNEETKLPPVGYSKAVVENLSTAPIKSPSIVQRILNGRNKANILSGKLDKTEHFTSLFDNKIDQVYKNNKKNESFITSRTESKFDHSEPNEIAIGSNVEEKPKEFNKRVRDRFSMIIDAPFKGKDFPEKEPISYRDSVQKDVGDRFNIRNSPFRRSFHDFSLKKVEEQKPYYSVLPHSNDLDSNKNKQVEGARNEKYIKNMKNIEKINGEDRKKQTQSYLRSEAGFKSDTVKKDISPKTPIRPSISELLKKYEVKLEQQEQLTKRDEVDKEKENIRPTSPKRKLSPTYRSPFEFDVPKENASHKTHYIKNERKVSRPTSADTNLPYKSIFERTSTNRRSFSGVGSDEEGGRHSNYFVRERSISPACHSDGTLFNYSRAGSPFTSEPYSPIKFGRERSYSLRSNSSILSDRDTVPVSLSSILEREVSSPYSSTNRLSICSENLNELTQRYKKEKATRSLSEDSNLPDRRYSGVNSRPRFVYGMPFRHMEPQDSRRYNNENMVYSRTDSDYRKDYRRDLMNKSYARKHAENRRVSNSSNEGYKIDVERKSPCRRLDARSQRSQSKEKDVARTTRRKEIQSSSFSTNQTKNTNSWKDQLRDYTPTSYTYKFDRSKKPDQKTNSYQSKVNDPKDSLKRRPKLVRRKSSLKRLNSNASSNRSLSRSDRKPDEAKKKERNDKDSLKKGDKNGDDDASERYESLRRKPGGGWTKTSVRRIGLGHGSIERRIARKDSLKSANKFKIEASKALESWAAGTDVRGKLVKKEGQRYSHQLEEEDDKGKKSTKAISRKVVRRGSRRLTDGGEIVAETKEISLPDVNSNETISKEDSGSALLSYQPDGVSRKIKTKTDGERYVTQSYQTDGGIKRMTTEGVDNKTTKSVEVIGGEGWIGEREVAGKHGEKVVVEHSIGGRPSTVVKKATSQSKFIITKTKRKAAIM